MSELTITIGFRKTREPGKELEPGVADAMAAGSTAEREE
jgi:hypothetical protein